MTRVQRAIDDLRSQLAPWLKTGQLTVNLRDGVFESYETRTYGRVRRNTGNSETEAAETLDRRAVNSAG